MSPTNRGIHGHGRIRVINYYIKPVVSPVFCDKLSATLKIEEHHYHGVLTAFENAVNDGWAKKAYTAIYKQSCRLQLGDYDTSTLIQCQPHNETSAFFRIEANPSKLGKEGMAELQMLLNEILPHGYAGLVQDGISTRVDTAVDIMNIEMSQIVYRYPGMRLSKAYYAKGKPTVYCNEMLSYYLGSDGGKGAQICIYDKTAQAKTHNVKHPHNKIEVPKVPTVRIEIRHRNRRMLSRLYTLKNLFSKLDLYSFHKIPPRDDKFNLFVGVMQAQGLQNALLMLSGPTRKLYRKRVESAKPDFWQPEEHWENWEAVVDGILHPSSSALAPSLQSIAIA